MKKKELISVKVSQIIEFIILIFSIPFSILFSLYLIKDLIEDSNLLWIFLFLILLATCLSFIKLIIYLLFNNNDLNDKSGIKNRKIKEKIKKRIIKK